jgi:hypothetical protein
LDAEALVLQKISESKFLCRMYVAFPLISSLTLIYLIRNKIQILHNSGEKTKNNQEQEFVDLEITVDETSDKLTGVEIEEGNFVSFRYGAQTDFTLNPKVSSRNDLLNSVTSKYSWTLHKYLPSYLFPSLLP